MNTKGFTLIELIITISLIIVIVLIVVPKLNYDKSYLESFTKELAYDIRKIRINSMTNDKELYYILLTNDSYELRKSLKRIKLVKLKTNFKLDYIHQEISFNYNGTPDNSQTITITNKKTKESKKISIVVETGRILILE